MRRTLRSKVLRRVVPVAAPVLAGALFFAPLAPLPAQSRAASRAASNLLGGGSIEIVGGSAEIFSGAAQLVIVSIEATARGVRLVLRPVAGAASHATELSAAVTIEIAQAAWEAAVSAAKASGRAAKESALVVGGIVQTVVLTGALAASAAGALGTALVVGDIVIGLVSGPYLAAMIGHGTHDCGAHTAAVPAQ